MCVATAATQDQMITAYSGVGIESVQFPRAFPKQQNLTEIAETIRNSTENSREVTGDQAPTCTAAQQNLSKMHLE